MSSERAGVHTSGVLDREQARHVLARYLLMAEGHKTPDQALDALEVCVVQDPRLARIEAELDRHERETRLTERGELHLRRLRAILRGDQ